MWGVITHPYPNFHGGLVKKIGPCYLSMYGIFYLAVRVYIVGAWWPRYEQLSVKRNGPDSKVYGANMGPTGCRQDPGGSHVGPTKFAIWGFIAKIMIINIIASCVVLSIAYMIIDFQDRISFIGKIVFWCINCDFIGISIFIIWR